MAGFNYAQNIIGLKKGASDIHELEVEVANLSASVLEIKGDVEILSNKKNVATELIHSYDVTSTATEMPCAWEGYDLLIISLCFYGNVYGAVTVPVSYFSTTGSGKAVFIQYETKILSVYKSTNAGKIMAALTNGAANWGIDIQGVKIATPS